MPRSTRPEPYPREAQLIGDLLYLVTNTYVLLRDIVAPLSQSSNNPEVQREAVGDYFQIQ